MKYKQILPPAPLKKYVRYFWTLESDNGVMPRVFGPIADGCPGLIFQRTGTGAFIDHEQKKLPVIFLYGQTTKFTELASTGPFNTLGVYFHPPMLKSAFGFNAEELTNTCMDANDLARHPGARLSEQLLNAGSLENQLEILSGFLQDHIRHNETPEDRVTDYALSRIISSQGNVSIKELRETLYLSERNFERRFKQRVGMSPKLFSRVCQFQASLKQLKASNFDKLSDIAYRNGYADQSHFIRVFKEFAGCSPFRYRQRSREIVENFPELVQGEPAA